MSDKGVRICQLCCSNDFLIRCIELAKTNVIHHRRREQICLLQYNAKRSSEVCFLDLIYVNAVITDLSILNVIKTIDQIHDRRLTRTRGTDKSNFLTGLCKKLNVVKHHLLVRISKIDTVKHNLTLQLHVGNTLIRLMDMLPGPDARSLRAFLQISLDLVRVLLCANQRHVTFIHFRLFIQQIKHTLCTRHRHNNTVQLHAHLVDRHVKAPVQGQESRQATDGKATDVTQRQGTADTGAEHVRNRTELCVDGHHDIRKFICLIGAVKKRIVQFLKFRKALILMTEHLNDLLSTHHLFDVAIYLTQVLLLFHEIFPG